MDGLWFLGTWLAGFLRVEASWNIANVEAGEVVEHVLHLSDGHIQSIGSR